jgi:hypothetical protein
VGGQAHPTVINQKTWTKIRTKSHISFQGLCCLTNIIFWSFINIYKRDINNILSYVKLIGLDGTKELKITTRSKSSNVCSRRSFPDTRTVLAFFKFKQRITMYFPKLLCWGTKCCLYKNLNNGIRKKWKKIRVNENLWTKNDERKWSERKSNLHPLVTVDTDSLFREVSNKWHLEELTQIWQYQN